ncbi:amidase [Nadsonia fulvescens var. elongata DSM 6958]|uniref:Amidase n=1 Tax=Nadsonia fulvescens var. elongata DSM 6958 TaxID=857566 RepID=A0A1E3PDH7_9ASCO|nr:amidase [Nadsonia fulvescens var. elongata DSM 6958]
MPSTNKINAQRLLETIHTTALWGAKGRWGEGPTETGVCRLALSDEDKSVRDWFISETKSLGCSVKVDEIGNIFAIYPGKNEGIPTGTGSHLDTQPTGGRYDGILGVLGGLEVLRTFKENNYVPNYPVALIDWCNEEGARFPRSMMASAVWAETLPLQEAYEMKSITETEVKTVKEELIRIGYLGETPASYRLNPLAAHFELHIEQGPILEDSKKKIGIVQGGQAFTWYKVVLGGKASHTGTTPLSARSDALLAASKMIVRGNEIAHEHEGLVSVGIIEASPAVVNVVPSEVMFTVDARHHTDEGLKSIIEHVIKDFTAIAAEGNGTAKSKPINISIEHDFTSPAIHFSRDCVAAVEAAAHEVVGKEDTIEIVSGAGHDSCNTSFRCPTSMIFVPSKDGISHNPVEFTNPEEIADGVQVLLNTIVNYDLSRKN